MSQLEILSSQGAPAALGHYVQGMACGNLTMTSGQIALCPESGELIKTPAAAMRQVLENLLAIVEAAGGKRETIARVDIAVTGFDDWKLMNEAYTEFFGCHKPTRFVSSVAGLPAGATIEASVLAFKA